MDTANAELLPLPVVLLMPTKHMGNLLVSLASIAALAQAAQGRSLVIVDHSYRDIAAATDLGPLLYFPRKALASGSLVARLRAGWRFFSQLRRFNGRLIIDFDGQRASGWVCRLAGVRECIGPSSAKIPRAYSRLLPEQHLHPHRYHDYAAYCRHYLGAAPAPAYPTLKSPTAGRELLADLGIDANAALSTAPLISLHVGATKDYKQWPAAYFAELADWLAAQGFQVALVGAGKIDGERIAQVLAHCRQPSVNLHNRLTLGELIALFQASRFFIGNDSGPMHLAAATGIPVFAIFGPTDPARWAPLGDNATVIRSATPCGATCSRKRCTEDYRCMTTLDPDVVKARVTELLPARSSRTRLGGADS